MNARAKILARLRATPPAELPVLPDVAGWYAPRQRNEDATQRVARLRAALEASHAEVHDTTAVDWPALLQHIAAEKGLRTLLIGTNTAHGTQLHAAGAPALQLRSYEQPVEQWRDALFDEVDASLTRAKSAVAETGSLILWPDASEPRLMSLVPPVHFVLLDVNDIHADFHSAMRVEGWSGGLPTNVVLISGPSKTADIQQTLAYGAHGPRELVVMLCHGQGAAA